jgi:5'-nucleotidase / UDP-sugar diphosphatase
MGRDAAEVAPFAKPLTFRDPIEVARNMVQILREEEQVDVAVMLSHCGIWEKESISEDEIIAQEVAGIDIIVSDHTPTIR